MKNKFISHASRFFKNLVIKNTDLPTPDLNQHFNNNATTTNKTALQQQNIKYYSTKHKSNDDHTAKNEPTHTIVVGLGASAAMYLGEMYDKANSIEFNPNNKKYKITVIEQDLKNAGGPAYVLAEPLATLLTSLTEISGCKDWVLENLDSLVAELNNQIKDLNVNTALNLGYAINKINEYDIEKLKKRIQDDQSGVPRKIVGEYFKHLIEKAKQGGNLELEIIEGRCINFDPNRTGEMIDTVSVYTKDKELKTFKGDEYLQMTGGNLMKKPPLTNKIEKYFYEPYIDPYNNLLPKLDIKDHIWIIGDGPTAQEQINLLKKKGYKNLHIVYMRGSDKMVNDFWESQSYAIEKSNVNYNNIKDNVITLNSGKTLPIDVIIDCRGFAQNVMGSIVQNLLFRKDPDDIKINQWYKAKAHTNYRMTGSLLGSMTFLGFMSEMASRMAKDRIEAQVFCPKEQEYKSAKLYKNLSELPQEQQDHCTIHWIKGKDLDEKKYKQNLMLTAYHMAGLILHDSQVPKAYKVERDGEFGVAINNFIANDPSIMYLSEIAHEFYTDEFGSSRIRGTDKKDNQFDEQVRQRILTKLSLWFLGVQHEALMKEKIGIRKVNAEQINEYLSYLDTYRNQFNVNNKKIDDITNTIFKYCYVPFIESLHKGFIGFTNKSERGEDGELDFVKLCSERAEQFESYFDFNRIPSDKLSAEQNERHNNFKAASYALFTERSVIYEFAKCLQILFYESPTYKKESKELINHTIDRLKLSVGTFTLLRFHNLSIKYESKDIKDTVSKLEEYLGTMLSKTHDVTVEKQLSVLLNKMNYFIDDNFDDFTLLEGLEDQHITYMEYLENCQTNQDYNPYTDQVKNNMAKSLLKLSNFFREIDTKVFSLIEDNINQCYDPNIIPPSVKELVQIIGDMKMRFDLIDKEYILQKTMSKIENPENQKETMVDKHCNNDLPGNSAIRG